MRAPILNSSREVRMPLWHARCIHDALTAHTVRRERILDAMRAEREAIAYAREVHRAAWRKARQRRYWLSIVGL
ncbi:MAG: hypothetical protein KGL39_09570 [Patescibacteria group bacterium]|nr:hypothetical protein [Patescibacteria group bacterium]